MGTLYDTMRRAIERKAWADTADRWKVLRALAAEIPINATSTPP
jgi:hypothetical protein